eukprot:jgi/Botrbrau1/807/Bobra.0352s0004.1
MVDKTPLGDPLTAISLEANEEDTTERVNADESKIDNLKLEETSPSGSSEQTGSSGLRVRSPLEDFEAETSSVTTKTPRDDPQHLAAARVDTMPSYMQLMASSTFADDDSVFGESHGSPNAATLQGEAKREPDIKIDVRDPQKWTEQGGFPTFTSNYISYLVVTHTSLPSYPQKTMSVRRRFRDFVALADLLKLTHRGYFIPPRPEKSTMEGARMTNDFVNLRRDALLHYLRQLAAHPVIRESEALKVFLTADTVLGNSPDWIALHPMTSTVLEGISRLPKQLLGQERVIPLPTEAAQSAKASNDVLRYLKEGVTALKVDFKDVQASSEDETLLRNERVEVEEFQERVVRASRKAEKVVGRMEEMELVLGDLGLSMMRLSKYEETDGSRCAHYSDTGAACRSMALDFRCIAAAAIRITRVSKSAISLTTEALSPLHDHLALIPAIKKGLKEREDALLTHYSIGQDLEKKKSMIAALQEQEQKTFGGDKNKTRKVASLQNDVAALETALEAAAAEYEKVKKRNLEEVQRLNHDRNVDFEAMLGRFVQAQLKFAEFKEQFWARALAELSAHKPQ